MRRSEMRKPAAAAALALLVLSAAAGRADAPAPPAGQLYVVATSHLDTQWRWTIRETIDQFLPATLRDNLALFARYPDYVFSFEGAFRYMLMREYYPEEYEQLKRHIADGRWRVAGSWLDAVDVNLPAPESLIRHALLGNGHFRREFGVASKDVFLPDCFGFGHALPSLARHCGITGFSTQKLTWGAAAPVPFAIGLWEGVDGRAVVAALQPGDYVARLTGDLSADSTAIAAIDRQAAAGGLRAALRYFGTGDQGGAPAESSVAWLQRSLRGRGPVAVRSVSSDQLARDLEHLLEEGAPGPELPRYRGELLMTDHGVGCYTSQAEMKRLNRRNERMAEAAERAAVLADWLGGLPYPRATLREAWIRFLWHQFHDDLTGTSIPEAYVHSWNDEALSLRQFAAVYAAAAGAVVRALDTRAAGVPIVVHNPLAMQREEVIEAAVVFPGGAPSAVRVYDPDGRETPSQLVAAAGDTARLLLLARAPAAGFAVYDARPAQRPCRLDTGLEAAAGGAGAVLANKRYRVRLGSDGDIAAIEDLRHGRELLRAPLSLQLLDNEPREWPAWEIDHDDLMAPPRAVVGGPASIQVTERGPARVAVRIERQLDGSTFVQHVRLAAGEAGDRVEIEHDLDWRTPGTLLKAAFPLAVSADSAVYDLGLGAIRRGVNTPRLYEVPAQQWADVSDPDAGPGGGYGVTVMNDARHGWDRPDAGTLRLTLVHTPRIAPGWGWVGDQVSQDLGRHRVRVALSGHAGDWRAGGAPQQADRLNQPLRAFRAPAHPGALGKRLAPLRLSGAGGPDPSEAMVSALKLAEESDEVVVRLQERHGRPSGPLRLEFAAPVLAAREIDGAEQPLGPADAAGGVLRCELAPFQMRAFALRLGPAPARLEPPVSVPLALPYDLDGISDDAARTDGDFDGRGRSLASELLPAEIVGEGITLRTGPRAPGAANVLVCRGQELELPLLACNRVYLAAASVGGDRAAVFTVDGRPVELWVQDWAEPIGQWDSRLVGGALTHDPGGVVPGYLKPAPLAWIGAHRHDARGRNEAYTPTQIFKLRLELPPGARRLGLPDDPRLRLLAATAARNENDLAVPAAPLLDLPPAAAVLIRAARRAFIDSLRVELASPNPGAEIRYTLDGSRPGTGAALYSAPLLLTSSTTVTARAFAPGLDDRFAAAADFRRLRPRAPDAAVGAAGLVPGLRCRYFEGRWDRLPDFAALEPAREERVAAAATPPFARPEEFACEFTGWYLAPRDGMYTFSLRSDDGSALHLGGELLIDDDGLHGKGDARAETALAAGPHRLRLLYFQRGGDQACELWVEEPGEEWAPIAPERLAH